MLLELRRKLTRRRAHPMDTAHDEDSHLEKPSLNFAWHFGSWRSVVASGWARRRLSAAVLSILAAMKISHEPSGQAGFSHTVSGASDWLVDPGNRPRRREAPLGNGFSSGMVSGLAKEPQERKSVTFCVPAFCPGAAVYVLFALWFEPCVSSRKPSRGAATRVAEVFADSACAAL